MSGKQYTQIIFTVKRETGVISFLMLNGRKLGLLYTKKFERNNGDETQIVAYYTGSANATEEEIKDSFLTHPGVVAVTDISAANRADMRKNPRPDVVAA